MRPESWLIAAGLGTWIVSSSVTLAAVVRGDLTGPPAGLWLAAFAAFGFAFSLLCWIGRRTRAISMALMAVQATAALVMVALGRDTLCAAMLVVVAGQTTSYLGTAGAAVWVAAQTGLLAVVLQSFFSDASALQVSAVAAAFGGFQLFAVATAWLADRERAAREELSRANAELHATRAMVAESSRAAERLRISRDLHDALGHHLTALSLQLDVASRLADGPAAAHIHQAHAIARLLLADVRAVVSQLRDAGSVDVADAIRALVPSAGGLHVHLDMPASVGTLEHERAHAIVRCLQEVMTNALRHGKAHNLWITIAEDRDGVRVHARDDGKGAGAFDWGNGLRGMRERFEALAGRVDVETRAGEGFEVRGVMPRAPTPLQAGRWPR
jgi:signal transduction histidine kinase